MADAPKPTPTRPPRTTSNPGTLRAQSAARAEPLPEEPKSAVKERLRESAADTVLNTVAILRETWDDFRRADQFFKYKAAILAAWLALSATGFVVACPGASTSGGENDLGATLVSEPARNEYMIKNDGPEPWVNVVVTVNGLYTLAVPSVAPGGSVVFGPKQLFGAGGQLAPSDLRVTDIQLATVDDDVELMRRGQIRH